MDDEIIALLAAGRTDEAFERTLAAYRRRVHALAYSIVRNRATAEDVAQEVFVKLWKSLPRFDGRAQLSTWIYAIARNAAISALRRERPQASLSDPAVHDEADAALAADRPAEREHDARLLGLVEALPEKQRQAVTLYYLEERSCEEVAAMLAMPVNTVKTHLHRARASLAAALGPRLREDAA